MRIRYTVREPNLLFARSIFTTTVYVCAPFTRFGFDHELTIRCRRVRGSSGSRHCKLSKYVLLMCTTPVALNEKMFQVLSAGWLCVLSMVRALFYSIDLNSNQNTGTRVPVQQNIYILYT
jgi:hypothetical protein